MATIKKKTLVLLDAHAILHRAYHALPDFASSKGEPTGGLYGLSTMLIKIINELQPDYLIACYDLPKPTYRHEAYDGYKKGRKAADEALISQMKRSRDVFTAFSIPMYDKVGFEADDVIGTIVEETKDTKDIEVIIASGDMDTLQLVEGKKVRVYTLRKGIKDTVIYDEKGVKERYGFAPKLLPDFKGLRGDPSDNIIGVAGIGEKTGTDLVTNFGTIENLYKILKKDESKLIAKGIKPRIVNLLKENEEEAVFSKMLATIRRDAPIDFVLPQKKWREEIDVNSIMTLFNELDFRALQARVKTMLNEGAVVNEEEEVVQVEEEVFDPVVLREAQILVWILDSNVTNPTREDVLEVAGVRSVAEAREYLIREVEKRGLLGVFETIEKPLIQVVEDMNAVGIKINRKILTNLSKDYHKELDRLRDAIWKEAGEEFNINSPKQLGVVLYERLGLKPKRIKRTSTGQYSTKESELEKMKADHVIIELILRHRELQKLLSTYIDTIPKVLGKDDRLLATFLSAGSTTGRMSSKDPNLQNIPIQTELGRNIRKAFVAEEGHVLAAFDYSQIELRIAAFLSGDEKLCSVFKKGEDIHTAVASEVFGVSKDKVDSEMRRRAKVINFGILYGMGVSALQANLGSTRKEAQEFLNAYFEVYSGLARYIDAVKVEARTKGYTETFFGRRRYFKGIDSSIPYVRASAERMAVNAPIQGTEADVIKIAMINVDESLKKNGLKEKVRLLLQVHDELVYEIKKDVATDVVDEIKQRMETIFKKEDIKEVPIVVVAATGSNWGAMKD